MDKEYLAELSHIIKDSDKKVNLNFMSNKWDLTLIQCEELLEKWIKKEDSTKFSKEFIIRGIDANGNAIITIVNEKKLNLAKKQFKKIHKTLFSVETVGNSRDLGIGEIVDTVINLPLKGHKRPVESHVEPEESRPANVEVKPVIKEKKISPDIPIVKAEKKSPPVATNGVLKATEETKKVPSKDSKKKFNGKNSITSFFGKDLGNSKPKEQKDSVKEDTIISPKNEETKSPKKVKSEMVKPKEAEKLETNAHTIKETDTNNRKRPLSDTNDVNDSKDKKQSQPAKKLQKVHKKNIKGKKSRLMQMEDSSDEESLDDRINASSNLFDTTIADKNVSDEEDVVSDVEKLEPIKEKIAEPIKKNIIKPIKFVNGKRRYKSTRLVYKTYEDEEGYLLTVQESEQYSSEEEENAEHVNEEKVATVEKKEVEDDLKKPKEKTPKQKPVKQTATKQGSIMSFFNKK